VGNKTLSVAYAQNLLSTVNVVLATLRKDRALSISPRQYIGERSHIRQHAPCLDRNVLTQSKAAGQPISQTRDREGYQSHILMVARLARDFGLRFREASLLDARQALKEAQQQHRINITQGTKGGRGNEKDRWVPVTPETLQTLQQAASLQQQHRNLIPPHMAYVQWRNHSYSQWRPMAKSLGIKGFHELRAAYACERYRQITGYPAPVITGGRPAAPGELDRQARMILAQELGHGRIDVIAAYIGGAR
jgi:integrase